MRHLWEMMEHMKSIFCYSFLTSHPHTQRKIISLYIECSHLNNCKRNAYMLIYVYTKWDKFPPRFSWTWFLYVNSGHKCMSIKWSLINHVSYFYCILAGGKYKIGLNLKIKINREGWTGSLELTCTHCHV